VVRSGDVTAVCSNENKDGGDGDGSGGGSGRERGGGDLNGEPKMRGGGCGFILRWRCE